MDVRFFLKRPNQKEETVIFALCHLGHKEQTTEGKQEYVPVKIYTKEKIKPEFWNPKANRAKTTPKFPQSPEFNTRLAEIENDLKTLFLKLTNHKKIITPELFKREWDKQNNPTPEAEQPTRIEFVEFAEKFIINVSPSRAEGTITNYRNSLKHLKEFAQFTNTPLEFDSMGLDFHLDLMEYLKNHKKFAPNTIWRINKVLKMLLGEAAERKLTTNIDFKSKRFKAESEEPEVIYLNDSDLHKLNALALGTKPKLERVRDLFLVGCYSGLRFSDYNKLTPENITQYEGVNILNVNTQKTGQNIAIPLHPVVITILEKYKGQMPKGMSNQKFNEYLKQVARLAGITEPVTLEKTKGNLTITKTVSKWELVTTHTARRSFATNTFTAGMPAISIMKITGHRTEKAFLRYIRINEKENARLMAGHDFFKVSPLKIAE